MPFCTTCGANVNGAFCPQCGTPIGAASAPPPPAPQPGAPQPNYAQPYGVVPPPGMQPMPPARKTSPLVWVLVIVLGLMFLGFASCAAFGLFVSHKIKQAGVDPELMRTNPGLAVGKIIAATNPNIDVVRTDEGSGTITLRDKRTGKETTMTFDQAKNGQFSITADDDKGGKATMQFGGAANTKDLPSWVPKYPGSEATSTFAIKGSGAQDTEGGSFAFTTPDSGDKVIAFYKNKSEDLGMKAKVTTSMGDGGGMFSAADQGDQRSLTVIVGKQGGSTSVSVTYGSKK